MSLHVKPAPGLVVRAPDGAVIPPEGAHLADGLYLRRRIAEGDLVVVEAEPPPPPAASSKGGRA
jgi:hypothetical protein